MREQRLSEGPWLGVEMRHLATLAAIARTGSFRSAGSALGYAQSTVSEHIAALEQFSGRQLVERRRGRRGAVLTDAGRRLGHRAEQVVARLAAARADVAAAAEGEPVLRIAIARDVAPALLAPALARFHRGRPDVSIVLSEAADAQHVAALVREAAVDVGVAEPDGPAPLDAREGATSRRDPRAIVLRQPGVLAPRRILAWRNDARCGDEPAAEFLALAADPASSVPLFLAAA